MDCGRSRTIESGKASKALTLPFFNNDIRDAMSQPDIAHTHGDRLRDMHIGKKIQEILRLHPKEHTVTWFARQLNCHRVNVYDIFNRQTIDTELLKRISVILDHDFFHDISADIQPILNHKAPASQPERRGS